MGDKSIVPFIKGIIPPHISDSNSLLVPFLEAYYEWMHLPNNNYDLLNSLAELTDIDKSFVKFADEFKNEYLSTFPDEFLTDKTLTIKHINDLYKAKGTPSAVKLLLKMILGKESEIFYPSNQILKSSDGDWIQDNSILVEVVSGNVFDIVGKSIKITTTELSFYSVVERVRATLTNGIYEVFLEQKLIYDITKNTIVTYNNIVLRSKQTITNYKILKAGSGFKVGQLFEVKSPNGSGCFVKVKIADSLGGIKAIQIIKFGYGYESDFISGVSTKLSNTNVLVQFPNLTDTISNLSDAGYINKFDYFDVTYVDNTYVGDIVASFKSDSIVGVSDLTAASIEFNLGNKLKYPGYYNSIKGFLSDNIYLQDSFYYQAYSYVIKIDEIIEKYKSQVESTVNPAGLKMFGEYSIKNKFELDTQLNFILSFFRLTLLDTTQAVDVYSMQLTKIFNDSVLVNEKAVISLLKPLTDLISVTDTPFKSFTKRLNDSASTTDTNIKSFTKNVIDSITLNDSTRFNITLNKLDSVSVTDSISIGFLLSKYINDVQFISDSGGYLYLNYYSEPGYWSPDYATGAINF